MKTKSLMKGALAASLLAAGAAYFVNKSFSKETKSEMKKTVTGLTKNILERAKALKDISKANFESIVDAVIDEYAVAKKMSKETTRELRHELKSQWKGVTKELKEISIAKLAPKKNKSR